MQGRTESPQQSNPRPEGPRPEGQRTVRRSLRLVVTGLAAGSLALCSLGGCFKPDKSTLQQQHLEKIRKEQMVAPAERGAAASATAERRSRLTEEEHAQAVANIGGKAFTLGEFEARYGALPIDLRYGYGSPEKMAELLQHTIDFETIVAEATRLELGTTPGVQLPVKLAMVRAYLRDEAATLVRVAAVTNEDVRAEWESHPERYRRPPVVRALAAVVDTPERAELIRTWTLSAGTDGRTRVAKFRELAGEYSLDTDGRKNGGDIGLISGAAPQGDELPPGAHLPRTVRDAALALKAPGDVSPAIEFGARFWVVSITERRGGETTPLSEVEGTIRNRLLRERQEAAIARYVETARKSARVEIDEKALATVKPSAPAGEDGK